MSLLKLDLDAWRLLTQDLSFLDLYHLIQTCPGVFRMLKEMGGVRSATFVDYVRMKGLPRRLFNFEHLRELVIHSTFKIPQFSPGHLMYLPKTLWTLNLNFPNAFENFYRSFNCWTPPPSMVPRFGIETGGTLIDLQEALPELRTFVIRGEVSFKSPHEILPALPRSLTHLEIQKPVHRMLESLYTASACNYALPPNLVVLKLPRCDGFSDGDALFKLTSLEHLSLHACTNIPRLPSSLVKLKCKALPTCFDFNSETMPNLTSVTLLSENSPNLLSLPSNLVELSVPHGSITLRSHKEVLPPTLTKLDVRVISVDHEPVHDMFGTQSTPIEWSKAILPSRLRKINFRAYLPNSAKTSPGAFKDMLRAFPPTMQEIHIGLNSLRIDNIYTFPETLESIKDSIDISPNLTFKTRDGTNYPITDISAIFPNLRQCSLISLSTTEVNGKIIFPKSLISLSVNTKPLEGRDAPNLRFIEVQSGDWPPYLRRFSYTTDLYPTDDALAGLPDTITELSLYATHHHIPRMTHEGLSKLPNCLTSLSISSDLTLIASGWLHHLPRYLRSISLEHYDGMRDEHVKSLPSTITRIDMRNSTHLTDSCLLHLPSSLTELKLRRNRHFTPKLFILMPQGLKRIDIRKNPNFVKFRPLPQDIAFKAKSVSMNF